MRKFEKIIIAALIALFVVTFAYPFYTRQIYTAFLKVAPDASWAYRGLGNCDLRQSDYSAAVTNFSRAIYLNPGDYRAYFKRGSAYSASGDFNAAIADYTRAIARKKSFSPAYHNRGVAYNQVKLYPEAIADFTAVIEKKPGSGIDYYYRALSYRNIGEIDNFNRDFNMAISLDPRYRYELSGDAGWAGKTADLAVKGNFDAQLKEYNRLIDKDPSNAENYNTRGKLWLVLGEIDLALEDFQMALKLGPSVAKYHNNVGGCYLNRGEMDKAMPYFLKAMELAPRFGAPHCNIGKYFILEGLSQKAIEWLEKGKLAEASRSELYWNAGIAYRDLDNYEEAIRNWEKCMELDPRTGFQLQSQIDEAQRKIDLNRSSQPKRK